MILNAMTLKYVNVYDNLEYRLRELTQVLSLH